MDKVIDTSREYCRCNYLRKVYGLLFAECSCICCRDAYKFSEIYLSGVPPGYTSPEEIAEEARQQAPPVKRQRLGDAADESPNESAEEEEDEEEDKEVICQLCQRKFPTQEAYERHVQLSQLHAKNLLEQQRQVAAGQAPPINSVFNGGASTNPFNRPPPLLNQSVAGPPKSMAPSGLNNAPPPLLNQSIAAASFPGSNPSNFIPPKSGAPSMNLGFGKGGGKF